MATGAVTPLVEQTAKDTLVQGVKALETHSGGALLRSLGSWGSELDKLLNKFEPFRDGNKSFARESVNKIFKEVPEAQHQNLENAVLGKPHNLDPAYLQHAKKLETLKNTIETKAAQSGQKVLVSKKRVPFILNQNGPYVHHEDIMTPNSNIRKQAIQEIMQRNGPRMTASNAAKLLDSTVSLQRGRNGVSHIAFPSERIEAGRLPVAQRWSKYAESAAGKISENVFFGAKDQNLQGIVSAIHTDQGHVSANTAADFLDVYMREANSGAWRRGTGVKLRSAYRPTTETETMIRKFSGYLLTSRLAIPHATQVVNSMLNEGFINTLSGIRERITNYDQWRDLVVNSGALEEELHRNNEVVLKGGQGWFEKFFHQPGFHWERARFIEVAALSSQREIEMASDRVLSNPNSSWHNLMFGGREGAEATLKRLGIDPIEVTRNNGLTEQMRKTAMYNAAKNAMFFRSPLLTPPLRDAGPFRRMSYMYSHYHFNMFRILKDGFKNSFKEGGVSGLTGYVAKLGTLLPAAGFLLQTVENGIYRKNLDNRDISPTGIDPVDMYLNALAHASAFGIIYSINRANKQSLLTNLVTGPIPSVAINTGGDVIKAIDGSPTYTGEKKHDFRPVERDILKRIPVIGPTLAGTLIPYEDKPASLKRTTRHKKPSGAGYVFTNE